MVQFVSTRPCRARRCMLAIAGTASVPAQAQQKPVIKVSSLTLPVFNPLVWNIMKAQGFDAKHGFELDAHAYPSISAFYAGFATGETDVLIGGPTILQKLYQEGVPVRIIAHRLHARRSRHLHQERRHQVAGRSQGQATRRRHGRLAIPGHQDVRSPPRASTSARTSPSSTPISPWRARSLRPTASTPRW